MILAYLVNRQDRHQVCMEVVFSFVLTKQKYHFKLVNFYPIYFECPQQNFNIVPYLVFWV